MNALMPKGMSVDEYVAIEKEGCERSLARFLRRGWNVLDPGIPFVSNWHIDALAEHLEACAKRDITRLVINVPPGTSKSTQVSVFFPAWLWGPFGNPESRIISAAHEQNLAVRDNRKTRMLIESDWYQQRWPVGFVSDQNEKTFFENDARGWRQCCAVKSMTGRRGDIVIWDDPLSPEKAYSEVERDTANRVFSETLPTRLNDPTNSVIIIIMQRLHEYDVTGYILENDFGYEHLMIPMEFEPDRRCTTSIGWTDPRTEDGEILDPKRFPREVLDRDKKVMGSFAVAGQFQQRPMPREGGLFKVSNLSLVDERPVGRYVRGWDFAASEQPSDPRTAGVLIGQANDGRFVIADVVKGHYGPNGVRTILQTTAASDGRNVTGSMPQDPGQAGKAQVYDFLRMLAGYPYFTSPETGDKETRAMPLAAQIEAGNVILVKGDWNRDFIEELSMFPGGRFADQVDAASRAFMTLTQTAPTAIYGRQT